MPQGLALTGMHIHPLMDMLRLLHYKRIGMQIEPPSVGMLRLVHPMTIPTEQQNLWSMLRGYLLQSMQIEHYRTHIRCSNSVFSLRPDEVQ